MNQRYIEVIRPRRHLSLLLLSLAVSTPALIAQTPTLIAQTTTPADARAAQAGRAELEAMAAQAERAAATANSAKEREQRQADAAALRARLRDGDFQVGDRLVLTYTVGDSALAQRNDTLRVGAGRIVMVPRVGEVSLQGVLRSELQQYLTRQVGRFFRDPDVKATALIRVAVSGPVGRPGFYDVPADVRVSDAIMIAGGPAPNAKLDRTSIRRGTEVLLGPKSVESAIRIGATLDQLNLRAGDEIVVGEKKATKWTTIAQVVGVASSLAFTIYWLVSR